MTTTFAERRLVRVADGTLADSLAPTHDRWMAECDEALGPVTDGDATYLQRWTAVAYVGDTFPRRFQLEQDLVEELHPFILPEVRQRLSMQVDRLTRLQEDLEHLVRQRDTARDVAHFARALEEALRLWYADIEFAVGHLKVEEIGPWAGELLDRCISATWLDEMVMS